MLAAPTYKLSKNFQKKKNLKHNKICAHTHIYIRAIKGMREK